MSLKNKGDFLMHGVVLQIHVFRPRSPNVSRETSPARSPDVSRETVFSERPFRRANRSLNVSRETFWRCFT
jgi:hypothetical protein